ncbi:hypothetical protein GGR95_000191 [Sulfitobacter undariae]|uniref:Uncharacterized protein n=1 Tax=Sulfitobacter undariae TaxID=1563671 RepID=A0A7W6E0N7_9RHOB|nr:hypothetical protein [Sulfitobacter undariae]
MSDCIQPAVHIPLKTLTAVYHSQPKA